MNFDEELQTVLQKEASNHVAPPELKAKILKEVLFKQGGRQMKKWLVASIVAAALLIPTGAYAGYNYLADSIYGSQENVVHVGVTEQKYDELEAKLQRAKQNFNEEEFTKLMSLLKELGEYNLKMADAEGVVHLDRLSVEEQKAYESLNAELEPYSERLNEVEIQREVDRDTFWNSLLYKAEERLTNKEFEELEPLINELQSYDAKVFDSDGSIHMERLSKEETQNQEKLMEALDPYIKKIDMMVKPSS